MSARRATKGGPSVLTVATMMVTVKGVLVRGPQCIELRAHEVAGLELLIILMKHLGACSLRQMLKSRG